MCPLRQEGIPLTGQQLCPDNRPFVNHVGVPAEGWYVWGTIIRFQALCEALVLISLPTTLTQQLYTDETKKPDGY